MKHCKDSSKCCYRDETNKNICAYDINMHEQDLCPRLFENWNALAWNFDTKEKDLKWIITIPINEEEKDIKYLISTPINKKEGI